MSLAAAKSAKVKIVTRFSGSVSSVFVGYLVKGSIGAMQAYVSEKEKRSGEIFTKTITSRLITWGAPHLAKSAGIAVVVAFEYLYIEYNSGKQLDKRDKYLAMVGWIFIKLKGERYEI